MTDPGNSKGPAPVQAPAWLNQAPAEPAPEAPLVVPADQVRPEDVGTSAIEYRDGRPVIVVSGGEFIPAGLAVVDGSGNARAAYRAFPAAPPSEPLPGWQEGAMMSAHYMIWQWATPARHDLGPFGRDPHPTPNPGWHTLGIR